MLQERRWDTCKILTVTGVCREEYLVCELACLISSVGGYLGLFFGVSILDTLFLGEWISRQLQRVARK